MYSRYIKLTQDAIAWLDKTEPEWKLDEPIDREAFLEDLLERAGLKLPWTEEFKSILDQKAKCKGVKMT